MAHIGHAREAISTARPVSLSDGETARPVSVIVSPVIVYAIIDARSSPDHPLGDAVEVFIRR